MKKADVKIGSVYAVKVSGWLAPVRITAESPYGGWNGINQTTGREIRIRTAAKICVPLFPYKDGEGATQWTANEDLARRLIAFMEAK